MKLDVVMSITMNPELEARLRSRAQEEGIGLEEYLDRLLREEEAHSAHIESLLEEASESGEHIELTGEEWAKIEQGALAETKARSTWRE